MFEVNGTTWCPYCQEAKELLQSLDMEVEFIDLDDFPEKAIEFLEAGAKTIPQIYHGGNHIGGFQELQRYLKETDKG